MPGSNNNVLAAIAADSATRRWAAEVECAAETTGTALVPLAAVALVAAGYGVERTSTSYYGGTITLAKRPGWEKHPVVDFGTDGTVRTSGRASETMEVRCGHLPGDEGEGILTTVLGVLRAHGAVGSPTNNCGGHVHVNVGNDYTSSFVRKLARLIRNFAAILRARWTPRRNYWAAPLTAGNIAYLERVGDGAVGTHAHPGEYDESSAISRYAAINIPSAYRDKGTVEHRWPNGAVGDVEWLGTSRVARRITSAAIVLARVSNAEQSGVEGLRYMMHALGLHDDPETWAAFAGPLVETARSAAERDGRRFRTPAAPRRRTAPRFCDWRCWFALQTECHCRCNPTPGHGMGPGHRAGWEYLSPDEVPAIVRRAQERAALRADGADDEALAALAIGATPADRMECERAVALTIIRARAAGRRFCLDCVEPSVRRMVEGALALAECSNLGAALAAVAAAIAADMADDGDGILAALRAA